MKVTEDDIYLALQNFLCVEDKFSVSPYLDGMNTTDVIELIADALTEYHAVDESRDGDR